ncbi:MAG: diguanylate cyclase [Acaryochloridaceae cyanobacterium SU_2_1]|nr:diguanylate cyclase [Acaryochloridaceae cyanobacterium SU_2_1]
MKTSNTRILIIENNTQDIEIVRELLNIDQLFPITLEHRQSLAEGMERLSDGTAFDLVLLNPQLSDAQGLEAFQAIHQAFPSIPLIIYSDNLDEKMILDFLQRGAQDYLAKGHFDRSRLCSTIRYALERHSVHLELAQKNATLQQLSIQLEQANHKLKELTLTDSLTGVYNRRRFDTVLLSEWIRLMREAKPLSLIMCDVDYFKAYNDTYGHRAGDQCLQQIAQAIRRSTRRPTDCVARYGGEEFMVTLPNTDILGATHVANLIHNIIHELALPHLNSPLGGYVTLSLGVASRVPDANIAPSTLVEAADQALYLAKQQGRDRIHALCLESPLLHHHLATVTKPRSTGS